MSNQECRKRVLTPNFMSRYCMCFSAPQSVPGSLDDSPPENCEHLCIHQQWAPRLIEERHWTTNPVICYHPDVW